MHAHRQLVVSIDLRAKRTSLAPRNPTLPSNFLWTLFLSLQSWCLENSYLTLSIQMMAHKITIYRLRNLGTVLCTAVQRRRAEGVTWIPTSSCTKNFQVLLELHWAWKALAFLTRRWFYNISVGRQVWKCWVYFFHPCRHLLFIDWGCTKKCTVGLIWKASNIRNNLSSSKKQKKFRNITYIHLPNLSIQTACAVQYLLKHSACSRVGRLCSRWCSPMQ